MLKNNEENLYKLRQYVENSSFNDIDIVDLIKYLAIKYGASFVDNISKETFQKLEQIIQPKNKVLLILMDGMGAYKVSNLNDDSLFRKNLKYAIKTVNPTSTACVLTTIGSAMYPSEHGILGWWAYNKELDLNYYPLLFEERKTHINLMDKNIKPEDIFKFESVFDKFRETVNIYMDTNYITSAFSNVFSGIKANKYGFLSIRDAFKKVDKNLNKSNKSFNYMYIDGLDLNSHIYGIDSKEVMDIISETELEIDQLVKKHRDLTVIVVSDHGQVDMKKMIYLNANNDYSKYFYATPSIDTRMISFFVKEEFREEFENKFLEEFSDDVILLSTKEAMDYNLFGGYKTSTEFENAVGEYIAIVVNEKFMVCDKISYEDNISTKGNHSGLTKEETTIPLIVI